MSNQDSISLGFRPDIQGLRALAVLMVLVFHVFPSAYPGGYIGVDIFFVISGYLISSGLLKQQASEQGISLLGFYERRIRRLMPAATLVLVFGAIGTLLFLPQMRWLDTAYQLLASAFYVENWYLYAQSVDYLQADTPAGPFQHYWSLSIEEQFYIGWPMLVMLGGAFLARGSKASRVTIGGLFFLTFAVSLAASIIVTVKSQPMAYFMTWTRVWELALGGLAAVIGPRLLVPYLLRIPLMWSSLAVIIVCGYIFTGASAFPGYIALFPTLATVILLLCGGGRGALTTDGLMSNAVSRYIGDISYSLYLWHWPLVVFALAMFGKDFSLLQGGSIIGLAIVFSALTKPFIEDVFRQRVEGGSIWRVIWLFIVCILLSLAAAAALYLPAKKAIFQAENRIIVLDKYPGAAILMEVGAVVPELEPEDPVFIPELIRARNSYPDIYTRKCHVPRLEVDPIACEFLPPKGTSERDFTVMLVGDSHAGHWVPAIQTIAAERGWTLITHTKSSCAYLAAPLNGYPECTVWNEAVQRDMIMRKPDLVFTSMVTNHAAAGAVGQPDNQERLARGLIGGLMPLLDMGTPVILMHGTPRMGVSITQCLAENEGNPAACSVSREKAMGHGGAVSIAAALEPRLSLVDLTDALCGPELCAPIVGNVVVYRDQHHITTAYMATLKPYLEAEIDAILPGRDAE